ncbi:uncharacterized protein LOC127879033 [Dreissena polymorpha]|uniref:uncharacterized protein LOC127879033 n=1 Tax=Dreissena polymorpha TaxID=45954 RepID=UPI002264DBC0|nr:uncharacterized protein LOC127879033 [Dreissena polymorpha]
MLVTLIMFSSKYKEVTFNHNDDVFLWICVEFFRASNYSYYFYLYSKTEPLYENVRIFGGARDTTTANQTCAQTQMAAQEFHTLVRKGNETAAISAVNCPDPLLGSFQFTYTNKSGTYCGNVSTATINACEAATLRTHVLVNNSGCSNVRPFYSDTGRLGCVVSFTASGVSYASLYNLDPNPSTTFVCVAAQVVGNSTRLSMSPGDCTAMQTPTVRPSDSGATMVLEQNGAPCKYWFSFARFYYYNYYDDDHYHHDHSNNNNNNKNNNSYYNYNNFDNFALFHNINHHNHYCCIFYHQFHVVVVCFYSGSRSSGFSLGGCGLRSRANACARETNRTSEKCAVNGYTSSRRNLTISRMPREHGTRLQVHKLGTAANEENFRPRWAAVNDRRTLT